MLTFTIQTIASEDDRAFFFRLYEKYKKLVWSRALKYTQDPIHAEDITQDTWVRLIRYIDTLKTLDEAALASYIVYTVRSVAFIAAKRAAAEQNVSASDEDDIITLSAASAEEEFFLNTPDEDLLYAWNALSEDEQAIISGKYYLGLSDAEIAELAGCKPNSIRMKLSRIRRKLHTLMKKDVMSHEQ